MNRSRPLPAARTYVTSGLSGIAVGLVVWALLTGASVVAPSQSASAADGSARTITAREQDPDADDAPFPDLAVTVSQTEDLVQQGIKVSWTGARQSVPGSSSNGGRDFLQIFQCWGDDPTNPERPDRTTCQYGGAGSYGSTRDSSRRYEYDAIPVEDQPFSAPRASAFEAAYTSIPFRARNDEVVSSIKDGPAGTKVRDTSVDINNNQFFNVNSTNEVPWAGSGDDGTGSVSFEVQTTMQSPGLGCGDPVEVAGAIEGASCWLVILPRGSADNGSASINQSGLFWESWQHALAVRIGFAPVGARCPVGAAERQIAGSEVASLAVQSWQPTVCQQSGGAVFSHLTSAESDAVSAASTSTDAPLALTTYPLEGENDLVYAPVALSGVVISFSIDRNPNPFQTLPPEMEGKARLPFEELKLTPRLLAKLLTNSYWGSLPPEVDRSHLDPDNPENVTMDKEFLAVNSAEWGYQLLINPALSDVLMPQGRSDAARAVWAYIMADPEAAAFMAGEPDPNGMTVNPWFSTVAAKNPSGTAFNAVRDNFPKADPAEVSHPSQDPINVVTWRSYVNDLDASAYLTLRGDGQVIGDWDPNSTPPKYRKAGRSLPGFQRVLGISDAAAASRYEVRVASLRNAAGEFVQPTESALLAAAAAMQPVGSTGVVRYDGASAAAKGAATAYPLAVPVYASGSPSMLGAELRSDYADFIRYAATSGQVSGVALGQLPAGYAPLPASWATAATAAAAKLEAGKPAPSPAPTPDPSSNGGSSGSSGGSDSPDQPTQPDATGDPARSLSSSTIPADPDIAPSGAIVPISLLAGLGAALASAIASRRKAIRTWVTRSR